MMMRLARCALISLALTGLVACGGGGSKATPAADEPDPMPAPDPEPAPPPEPVGPAPEPPPEDAPPPPPPTPTRPDAGSDPDTPSAGPQQPTGLSAEQAMARLNTQPAFRAVRPVQAWRRGTGKGQTIMVIDDAIDVGHPQFQDRADSSKDRINPFTDVTYIVPARDFARCYYDSGCEVRVEPTLGAAEIDALADAFVNGAPTSDDSVVYCIGTTEQCRTHRGIYREVAAVREKGPSGRAIRNHGTAVASVALGKDLGVAPDAELYFISIPFPSFETIANPSLSWLYTPEGYAAETARDPSDTPAGRARDDANAAFWYRWLTVGSGATVINRSYGPTIDTWGDFFDDEAEGIERYRWIETNLPLYTAALRNPNGALVVTAAGNDGDKPGNVGFSPTFEASLAYYDPALRGRYLAVAGIGKDGAIARGSTRCGPLPDNWDSSRDGRHYCLAAPYYATVASARVVNGIDSNYEATGTSFSAPIVSGAVALVAEQFRGRLSHKEIGIRIVDTADRTDHRGDGGPNYGNSLIYGAGVLDIAAATAPIGEERTGTSQHTSLAFRGTGLAVPAAWGDLGGRTGTHELTTFDERNAPFWYPMGQFLSAAPRARSSVLPAWREDNSPMGRPYWSGLSWAPLPDDGPALSFAYGSSGVRDESAPLNAYGLSWSARRPSEAQGRLHAGLVFEDNAMLGGRGSGALAGGTHGLAFGAWSRSLDLGPVRVDLDTLWAGGKLESGSGLLVDAGGIYSQHSASLAYTPDESHGPITRLTAKQPLRAESGSIVVRRPISRTRRGEWVIEDLRLPAEPDARSVELSLAHERPLGQTGRMAFEVGHAVDAGHVRGASDHWLGTRLQIQF